jgi:hypothetical protein
LPNHFFHSAAQPVSSARRRAHRGDGFVECRENPRLADRRCDVMSVHVGPKVPTDTCEDHAPLARQIIEQLRGGVVYICDRACQAAHCGKPLFIADLVVAAVGDRAAAWLGAQRATFRARLFLL